MRVRSAVLTEALRYHDISCGHRVVGHENKCRGLHGHNYRIHFDLASDDDQLDEIGRVVDFGVIKDKLCMWLEDHWDHKTLLWVNDPLLIFLGERKSFALMTGEEGEELEAALGALVHVPFNPTAEAMAEHLLTVIGPQQLAGTNVYLRSVRIDETRKCSAVSTIRDGFNVR